MARDGNNANGLAGWIVPVDETTTAFQCADGVRQKVSARIAERSAKFCSRTPGGSHTRANSDAGKTVFARRRKVTKIFAGRRDRTIGLPIKRVRPGRITMGENNNDDDSSDDGSEDSSVDHLFNKAAADVKAGMAASSSDEDDDQQDNGIQLYFSGGGEATADGGRVEDAKIRRAGRDRKRRAMNAKLNSDDEDEVIFVPKSQSKKTPIRRPPAAAAAAPAGESVSRLTIMDSSDEEESPPQAAAMSGSAAGLDAETAKRLSELRHDSKRVNSTTLLAAQQPPRSPIDVDDVQTSRHRWITVKIDGSTDSATFTLEESNSIKDVIGRCAERFKIDLDTPIGLYHENRLLHNSDLLFDVPVRCTLIAKVHRKMQRVKEAPKGTMMRLTLRGPDGEKEIKIGSLL
jgi:hypothetical protein